MCTDPEQSRSGAESRSGTQEESFTVALDDFRSATVRARAAALGLAPGEYLQRLLAQAITECAHRSVDEQWP